MPLTIPTVLIQTPQGERAYDIYSCLLQNRIIMIESEINSEIASIVKAQLLYLDSISNEEISLYIDSPGGSISAGWGIIDTMNNINSDVRTIASGLAASMGAFILLNGTSGKRMATKHSEIMLHQPLSGFQGQASDIEIHANHIVETKRIINEMISEKSNQPLEKVEQDFDRDNFMSAKQALDYGLIDEIV